MLHRREEEGDCDVGERLPDERADDQVAAAQAVEAAVPGEQADALQLEAAEASEADEQRPELDRVAETDEPGLVLSVGCRGCQWRSSRRWAWGTPWLWISTGRLVR